MSTTPNTSTPSPMTPAAAARAAAGAAPVVPTVSFDWAEIKKTLASQIVSVVNGLVQAAAHDVQNFALAIAEDMVAAAQIADPEKRAATLAELNGQLRAVAELNRLRVSEAQWNVVQSLVGSLTRTVAGFVANVAVKGIIPV